MDTNVTKSSGRDLCLDWAHGCDLYDGPDHPAFDTQYREPYNAITAAFCDDAEWLRELLTEGKNADELCAASAALQAAMDGGSLDARTDAARTLAGLTLTLVKRAGFGVLEHYQSEAWHDADLGARRANAYAARTYDRVDA